MPGGVTPNLGMVLPAVGGDRDQWGAEINQNLETIDEVVGELLAAGHRLYVDCNGAAPEQNGSASRPFRTIMQAVNQVILNNDNAAVPYVIDVAPGVYDETVDLGDAALVRLLFEGHGAGGAIGAESSVGGVLGASVDPDAGNSLQIVLNNNQLQAVQFVGFSFAAPVHLQNLTPSGEFGSGSIVFADCLFGEGLLHNFENIGALAFIRCSIGNSSTVDLVNIGAVTWLESDMNGGNLTLETDGTSPAPAGFTTTVMSALGWALDAQIIGVVGGALLIVGPMHFGGSGGTVTVTAASTLVVNAGADLNCNLVVQSGGTLLLNAADVKGTITLQGGSTYQCQGSLYLSSLVLGAGRCVDASGAGVPTATLPVGSTYRRTDGGAGSTFYVTEGSAGNWVAK